MTKIIGFAGEKTSGKNTIANIFTVIALQRYNLGAELKLDKDSGKILHEGEPVDPNRLNPNIVRQYALADPIKEIAVEVFGLEYHQVYGSNDQKNELTDYYWENMPGVITNKRVYSQLEKIFNENSWREPSWPWMFHKKGRMSARQLMQFVGTEVFRKMNPQVWISTCKRRIEADNPEFALITDLRFQNEILVFSKDNTVVGLNKKSKEVDSHASEQVDLSNCKYLIKNESSKNVEDLIKCLHETFGKNKDLLTI